MHTMANSLITIAFYPRLDPCAWMRCLSSINLHTPGRLALHRPSLPRVDLRNRYCVRPERHGYFHDKRAQQFSKTPWQQIAAQRFVDRREADATEAVASRDARD